MVSRRLQLELKRLMKTCEEWEFLEEVTPIELDPFQRKVWQKSFEGFDWDLTKPLHQRYTNKVREVDTCAHRGYGKSFLEGCHRMVKMVLYPGWQSYTTYPKREQAMYSLAYTQQLMKDSKYLRHIWKEATSKGKTQLELKNGSYSFIISPSQRTATGYHVNQGYVGEAARWADDWDAIFEQAMLPMTNRKKGQIWRTSSSFGQRGFFYHSIKDYLRNKDIWVNNEPGMIKDEYTGDEREQAWLLDVNLTSIFNESDKERFRKKGDLFYRQEYLCDFLGATETYIPPYIINRQSRVFPQFTFEDIINGTIQVHYLGLDPGRSNGNLGVAAIRREGNRGNFLVVYEEVAIDHYTELVTSLEVLQKNQADCKKYIDCTGNQNQLYDWLESKKINITGVDFANGVKQQLMEQLSRNLRNGGFYLPQNNDLCMSQFNYIPFQLTGNLVKFPADYHALDALITINRKFGKGVGGFRMGGLNHPKAKQK